MLTIMKIYILNIQKYKVYKCQGQNKINMQVYELLGVKTIPNVVQNQVYELLEQLLAYELLEPLQYIANQVVTQKHFCGRMQQTQHKFGISPILTWFTRVNIMPFLQSLKGKGTDFDNHTAQQSYFSTSPPSAQGRKSPVQKCCTHCSPVISEGNSGISQASALVGFVSDIVSYVSVPAESIYIS